MEKTMVTHENLDFSNTCRTCLCNDKLNPIFESPAEYKRYSNALLMVAGVKIALNDGLPQKICTDCINTLNNSLRFRKQCKNVETKLLSLKKHIKIKISSKSDSVNDTVVANMKEDCKIKPEDHYEFLEDNDDDDKPLRCFVNIPAAVADSEKFNLSDSDQILIVKEVEKDVKRKRKRKELINNKDPPYQEINSMDCNTQRVCCKICHKELSIRSIDGHMSRMHPGADERKVKCELCDTYVLSEKLNRHVVLRHGDKGFRCGYCKIEHESREQLVDHVTNCGAKKKKRKISEAGRQMLECDVCHKTMQKSSLRMHIAIKHAGLGPVCEHCGRKFGNKFRLNEHYRAKHGYEKFKCSYCDFQSAGIMSMRNHERRHRGEKPFACEECGARFHAAYLLAQHKHSHRTEKLVKCDRCPARFKTRNGLYAHRVARHGRANTRRPTTKTDHDT